MSKIISFAWTSPALVAWRIIRNWVEAQLALIETDQSTLEEVMLPWALVGDGDRTVFEELSARGIERALTAAPTVIALPAGREQRAQ